MSATMPEPAAPRAQQPGTRGRRRPLRRAVLVASVCLVLLVALVLAGARLAYLAMMDDLGRIDGAFTGLEDRPSRPSSGTAAGAVNILLLGTDRRSADGTTGTDATSPAWIPGAQRADTVMVLHIDGDREGASVISIPRDAWVPVPGHGEAKVNAAFSFAGPSLAVATVERLTGLRMDHFAVLDWEGLRRITDDAGGVEVQVPVGVYDSARGVRWRPGTHHLDGDAALDYVRQRHGLPGGDLDRVRRQHAFLRTLSRATLDSGLATDPRLVFGLLSGLTRHVSVEAEWSLGDIAELALSLRGLDADDIDYLTSPVAGFDTVAGQSVVRLDERAGRRLWRAVRADQMDDWLAHHPQWATPETVR